MKKEDRERYLALCNELNAYPPEEHLNERTRDALKRATFFLNLVPQGKGTYRETLFQASRGALDAAKDASH